ncbi:uncharacterized protein PAE49_005371 isoform 2-T3 [Odontesthes bonariensis]|uniref:uncharacterized protein LOC142380000 isoform X2 n=1 Tax=Odontesthes bonariensis TaxID=219752 RepID=UPI003F58264C
MEGQMSGYQPPPRNGSQYQKKKPKRKQPHSADIVFAKGTSIHTIPSLGKVLKGITDCIIGLQYVWEYRSPSKSVPPHYQCKLCALARLQHDMIDHVKSWKHCFRYMKKAHPDMVACEEEDAVKDPSVKRTVKAAAAEVEKTEGRGQIKVILKEPFDVHAFKGLRSAVPKPGPPPMGPMGPPFGPRFSDSRFQGEYPSHGGPHDDYQAGEYGETGFGEYGETGFGGYNSRDDFPDPGMDRGAYADDMGHHSSGGGNGFGPCGGGDGYERSGLQDNGPENMYPNDYQGSQMEDSYMDRPMDKHMDRPGLMGAASDNSNSSLPNTLLTYLDSFRIESESDAQLVLKVTQKLTDVLMEYRLRNVSEAPSGNNLPMSSTSFSAPSQLQSNDDRFSSSFSGPSRFSDGPSRFSDGSSSYYK